MNFSVPYPIKIPEIIRPFEIDKNNIEFKKAEDINFIGLVKCKIIPPRHLYIPILPIRIPNDERLLFPLCILCAKKFYSESTVVPDDYECLHQDSKRAFTTTITTIELKEAILNGYRVDQIYQIWKYAESNSTIFRDFVRMFMRLKIESSGFPYDVKTADDRDKFRQNYIDQMGIEIDLDRVEFNPGLRHISKIILNRYIKI